MEWDLSIVLVVYKYSVVAKAIERKLAECGYNVVVVAEDYGRLKDMADTALLFIIYLPGDIADDQKEVETLDFIQEQIWNSGTNMMLIGEKKDRPWLIQHNVRVDSMVWLDRPVKMNELEQSVLSAIHGKGKKKILVVDDDPSFARMIKEWMKDDYQIYSVTSGMKAITFLLQTPVDLILLDYEMPVVDGPQVFQMLRQEPATRNIPVIFLTGVGTREGVERVMALKPDGYVLKSTTKSKLLESLREKL
ncbi:MAG: response regulator [Anaerovibrio sp.]|uniref:response regulator n=1 Tax=Anaerovibrio sp. TaxID=1872532 RepID=UPI0025C36D09|nr:response regulator [Anaerovibrio sp.]MBE6099455.1 response regulator [Anaerovibrio sp.]MBQ3853755.1 response regulator [Anaerovibrio sp.]